MMIQSSAQYKFYDIAIVGGGVLGLWAARHAIKRGETVILLEKRSIGAGASGGFLGALMPHMPDVWNEKKQLQYDGLTSIGQAIDALESETGLDCGYERCGRIIPLQKEAVIRQVERRALGADTNWSQEYQLSRFEDLGNWNSPDRRWVSPDIAHFGVQFDTLSARVNPRRYLYALENFVGSNIEIRENTDVKLIEKNTDPSLYELHLTGGDSVLAHRCVIANGWEAYPLLQPYMVEANAGKPIGRGVKGQAIHVQYDHDDNLPIVYHDGTYVVPHAANRVAIGSTSLNEWTGEPDRFDDNDMGFYAKALELVPALQNAPIVDRWAGVRPRNTLEGRGTSPWFGPVPGHEHLIALIGGFKITLGIAHLDYVAGHDFI